jgi:hypothetical protein
VARPSLLGASAELPLLVGVVSRVARVVVVAVAVVEAWAAARAVAVAGRRVDAPGARDVAWRDDGLSHLLELCVTGRTSKCQSDFCLSAGRSAAAIQKVWGKK